MSLLNSLSSVLRFVWCVVNSRRFLIPGASTCIEVLFLSVSMVCVPIESRLSGSSRCVFLVEVFSKRLFDCEVCNGLLVDTCVEWLSTVCVVLVIKFLSTVIVVLVIKFLFAIVKFKWESDEVWLVDVSLVTAGFFLLCWFGVSSIIGKFDVSGVLGERVVMVRLWSRLGLLHMGWVD